MAEKLTSEQIEREAWKTAVLCAIAYLVSFAITTALIESGVIDKWHPTTHGDSNGVE